MRNKNTAYKLLLNNQEPLSELMTLWGVGDVKTKIKDFLSEERFEILECNGLSITKIRKKSTGEVFTKGDRFYSIKWNIWRDNLYFDEALTGTHYGDSYYKNYIRAGYGGLYHLNEISLTDKESTIIPIIEEEEMLI